MTRRLLNFPTILSLLLCAAAAAMWVRSYWRYDAAGYRPAPLDDHAYGVISDSGTFCVARLAEGREGQRRWAYKTREAGSSLLRRTAAGFVYRNERGLIVGVPYWLLCLLAALLPVPGMLARKWKRRRGRLGLCPACGYDLRATPDKCPECGAAPSVST